tara:strand:+ start:380 stop:2692 length:2313 start_codon:yes stop_codon:yes gene_type:complete
MDNYKILTDIINLKKHKNYQDNIGIYNDMIVDEVNWYSRDKIDLFLKKHVEELQTYNKDKTFDDKLNENFKEVIIAAYTNFMRPVIYSLIINIEKNLNEKTYGNKNNRFKIPVAIVVAGGDGFNNFFSNKDKDNRLVSPDVDVKLQIITKEAIRLHKYMYEGKKKIYNNLDVKFEDDQIQVKKQILLVRNELYNNMVKQAKVLEKIHINKRGFDYNSNGLNRLYINLNKYCKRFSDCKKIFLLQNFEEDIDQNNEKFKYIFTNNKKDINYQVRYTLMKRGKQDNSTKDDPYKLNDVHLYAFDLCFKDKKAFQSIAGLLDIVISKPGHLGYMYSSKHFQKKKINMKYQLESEEIKIANINIRNINCITEKYYIEEVIKQITLGLRTKNKKITKDLTRFIILIRYYNKNKNKTDKNKLNLTIKELNSLEDIIKNLNDKELKKECVRLYEIIKSLTMNNQEGGSNMFKIKFRKMIIDLGEFKLNYPHFSEDSGFVISKSKEDAKKKNNYLLDKPDELEDMLKIELDINEIKKLKDIIKTYEKPLRTDILKNDLKYRNYIKIPKILHYIANDMSLNLDGCDIIYEKKRATPLNYEIEQNKRENIDIQGGEEEYSYSKVKARLNNNNIRSWALTNNNESEMSNIKLVRRICNELRKLLEYDSNNIKKLCYGYEDVNTNIIEAKDIAISVLQDSEALNLPKLFINNLLSSGVKKDLNDPSIRVFLKKLENHEITLLYRTIKSISEGGNVNTKRKQYNEIAICSNDNSNKKRTFSLF